MMNEDLYHYGVPGTKWGVRRNLRVLANHRKNSEINKARKDYRDRNITKDQRKSAIKKANSDKKTLLKSVNQKRTKQEFKEYKSNIKNQTLSEVPHARLKKGANTVNKLLLGAEAVGIAGGAVSLAGLGVPALAAGYGAISTAVGVGQYYCIQKGFLDKLA